MKTTLLFVFIILQINYAQIQNTFIDSVYPHQNSSYFQMDETIRIFFSEPMNASTISGNNVFVSGNLTGKHNTDVSYQSGSNSIEIQPTTTLKFGELISVTLDSLIQTASGENITPYVFQFNVKPEIGSLKFAIADSFQLNFSPTNITSGDFNNDGNVDVIVSNYDSSKYTIALNNGSGGFSIGEVMAGVFKPSMISFTDIDNDRDLDMIIPTNEENKIQIYTNTGQGIFYYTTPITANAPVSICPGDFDGDGDNDFVALLNYGLFDGRAYVYKNNGTGSFSESGYASVGFPLPSRNVVGDFDNDGDLDLVVGQSEYSGLFRILRNNGSGVFTSESGLNLGAHPDEFAGGDFDGDFDLDIFHCAWYANGLGFVINDGQGGFTDYLNLGNVGGQSKNPAANDFDGDGDLDYVAVFAGNNVGIVKNNGSPNFELYLTYPLPGLKGITAADFDNNGSVDIIGVSSTTNQIKFLKNCVDSLVAYYPFNGNANDESGNINHGIINNATLGMDRYGNNNSSAYFYGDWSFIEGNNAGNSLPEGNNPRTISGWTKHFIYNAHESSIFNYGSILQGPNAMRLVVTDVLGIINGYGYGGIYGNTNLIDSSWHFVSGVYVGGSERITKLYIDGIIDTIGSLEFEPNTILGDRWRIGTKIVTDPTVRFFVDEVKVFDFALTDQQIWEIYKATTTAPNLLSPGNDSTLINPQFIALDWDSTVTANEYHLIIASDSLFNTVIKDTITSTSSADLQYEFFIYYDNQYWKVRTINDGGVGPWSEINHFNFLFTDVENEELLPTEFALLQNYPNPFNPSTIISYHLPVGSSVTLKVYDVLGNEVVALLNEYRPAGKYEVEFNSASPKGARSIKNPASGIYFYQLKAGEFIQTRKMILIK